MAINKGDILVDLMYLGEGYTDQKTTGIVMEVQNNKALVYWFDRSKIWGIGEEYESFDLTKEKDVLCLETMKREFDHFNS